MVLGSKLCGAGGYHFYIRLFYLTTDVKAVLHACLVGCSLYLLGGTLFGRKIVDEINCILSKMVGILPLYGGVLGGGARGGAVG